MFKTRDQRNECKWSHTRKRTNSELQIVAKLSSSEAKLLKIKRWKFSDIPFGKVLPPYRAYRNLSPEGKLRREVHQALLCHPSTPRNKTRNVSITSTSSLKRRCITESIQHINDEHTRTTLVINAVNFIQFHQNKDSGQRLVRVYKSVSYFVIFRSFLQTTLFVNTTCLVLIHIKERKIYLQNFAIFPNSTKKYNIR